MGIENAGTFALGGDITVNRLGFGAMRLCGPGVWGHPPDRDNAARVLHRCIELGINLIDTADAYGPEVNEYQIAAALHPYTGLTIATKGGLVRGGPGDWQRDGRAERLDRCINNSLRRLEIDRIDLYQLHAIDDGVPLAQSLSALARAQQDGRIRHIGLSNVSVEQLDEACAIAPIVSVQNRYNLTYRTHQSVLDRCTELDIGFIPWYPLASAGLSRAESGALADVAAAHGATTSQIALAWLLHISPVMLPIPGTSKVAHLEENTAAADITLTTVEIEQLNAFAG